MNRKQALYYGPLCSLLVAISMSSMLYGRDLSRAIQDGYSLAALQKLVDSGADVGKAVSYGSTSVPLSAALKARRFDVVEFLLQRGAFPNQMVQQSSYSTKQVSVLELAADNDAHNNQAPYAALLVRYGAYRGYEQALYTAAHKADRALLVGLIKLYKLLLAKNLIAKGCLDLIDTISKILVRSSSGAQVSTQSRQEFEDRLIDLCL